MMLNPVDRSLLRLLLYYVLLVLSAVILARYVPAVRRAVICTPAGTPAAPASGR